ncbi:hypothetical protein Val02_47510 [Virgisporangium aliadipatigenens]|uniref:Uncharacterized protein n=1 Tax=Virgisporangium aliadipatigenens TaxID=741659 RepID=A0A8J3YPY9_9ACTN|nr:hypothetical protein Val02_47510 [Virgisporangium aliadipatigenens]
MPPCTMPSTTSQPIDAVCAATPRQTAATISAEAVSSTMSTRRGRATRSANVPAGSPNSSRGRITAIVMRLNSPGLASRWTMAMIGIAMAEKTEPNAEAVWPHQ